MFMYALAFKLYYDMSKVLTLKSLIRILLLIIAPFFGPVLRSPVSGLKYGDRLSFLHGGSDVMAFYLLAGGGTTH